MRAEGGREAKEEEDGRWVRSAFGDGAAAASAGGMGGHQGDAASLLPDSRQGPHGALPAQNWWHGLRLYKEHGVLPMFFTPKIALKLPPGSPGSRAVRCASLSGG